MPKDKKSPCPNQEIQIAELKDRFIFYYEQLPVQKLAAGFIGRDEDTIIKWRTSDPDFADRVAKARSEWWMRQNSDGRLVGATTVW